MIRFIIGRKFDPVLLIICGSGEYSLLAKMQEVWQVKYTLHVHGPKSYFRLGLYDIFPDVNPCRMKVLCWKMPHDEQLMRIQKIIKTYFKRSVGN